MSIFYSVSIFEYLKVYLVSDVYSKWVIYTFGVSARDRKVDFFSHGGVWFQSFMSIFLAFFCGVYVHACVRVCVCVCVCVCMRV